MRAFGPGARSRRVLVFQPPRTENRPRPGDPRRGAERRGRRLTAPRRRLLEPAGDVQDRVNRADRVVEVRIPDRGRAGLSETGDRKVGDYLTGTRVEVGRCGLRVCVTWIQREIRR